MKALIKKLLRESLQKLDNTLSDYDTIFPLAGSQIDGMSVRDSVPNTSSIGASLTDYVVLKGIREISFGQFSDLPPLTFHSKSEKERSEILVGQINDSSEINPLIVVVDGEGLYVLEGAHRFDALRLLKKKSFPALVVIDKEKSLNERFQHDLEKENARLETLFQEGNKYFPGLKMSTMAVDGATEPQMRFFIPQEDRWTSVGGFEIHLAGAKIKKIAEWLNSKHIQMVWSKTTNSIYVQGRNQEVRISDHRKGKHLGTDILVRWNTPLLEIMNAVYGLVKIK